MCDGGPPGHYHARNYFVKVQRIKKDTCITPRLLWFIIGSLCGSCQSKQILKPMLTVRTLGDDPIAKSQMIKSHRKKAITVVKRSELWLIWESEGTELAMCRRQFPALLFHMLYDNMDVKTVIMWLNLWFCLSRCWCCASSSWRECEAVVPLCSSSSSGSWLWCVPLCLSERRSSWLWMRYVSELMQSNKLPNHLHPTAHTAFQHAVREGFRNPSIWTRWAGSCYVNVYLTTHSLDTWLQLQCQQSILYSSLNVNQIVLKLKLGDDITNSSLGRVSVRFVFLPVPAIGHCNHCCTGQVSI